MLYLHLDRNLAAVVMVTGGTHKVEPGIGSAGINVRLERAGRLRN
jgi:hypothetical protein